MSDTTPLTIHYQETGFTIAWHQDRQVLHDRVYQILLNGRNVPQDEKTRSFVFDPMVLDAENRLGLVIARATEFHEPIQADNKTLVVRTGQQHTIKLSLSANRRRTQTVGDRKIQRYEAVAQDDLIPWATELLQRHGMQVVALDCQSLTSTPVHKAQGAFGIASARIQAHITVTDTTAFARAFLHGIGRQKGYGFGLMEVLA